MRNDFYRLRKYIAQQALHLPTTARRDLPSFFDDRLADTGTYGNNDRDDVKAQVRRAMQVCGLQDFVLHQEASTLNKVAASPAEEKQYAVAATVLAMSILHDAPVPALTAEKARLEKFQTPTINNQLRTLLAKGDIVASNSTSRVEFKNFKSCGIKRMGYINALDKAVTRIDNMMNRIDTQFMMARSTSTSSIDAAFAQYFGDPNAMIDTTTLGFQASAAYPRPSWPTAMQSHKTVVRAVLRAVLINFVKKPVRFYFGGSSIDTGTLAYVSSKASAAGPTHVHIGGRFFAMGESGLDSMAGTIVHECTHTFARTEDHKYEIQPCKNLVTKNRFTEALTNADSYMYFVETAFP